MKKNQHQAKKKVRFNEENNTTRVFHATEDELLQQTARIEDSISLIDFENDVETVIKQKQDLDKFIQENQTQYVDQSHIPIKQDQAQPKENQAQPKKRKNMLANAVKELRSALFGANKKSNQDDKHIEKPTADATEKRKNNQEAQNKIDAKKESITATATEKVTTESGKKRDDNNQSTGNKTISQEILSNKSKSAVEQELQRRQSRDDSSERSIDK